MKKRIRICFNVVIYCTDSKSGKSYTSLGNGNGLTRDEIVWAFLNIVEDTDGDVVNSIYIVPDYYYSAERLRKMADTGLPEGTRLLFSQMPPHNDRGCRPSTKSHYLRIDHLLIGEGL